MFINIKVITNAAKNQVVQKSPGDFLIRVTTTPVRGKANKKVLELLAKHFNVNRAEVLIVKGRYNSKKVINILEKGKIK